MTVCLCIRQGSKRNDDSVSVEELDWSAESQIPAEHLWCDFKCRPWAKNESPNTNDIWVHTGTVISYTSKLLQQRWNFFLSIWITFPSLLPQFGSAFFSSKEVVVPVLLSIQWMYKSLVFGDEFLAQICIYSHTRSVQLGLGLGFLQTSQVLPHWLDHNLSLILVLYTEALSCPNCCYKIRSTQFPRISLYS